MDKKNCALLCHYAAIIGNSLPTFRDSLSAHWSLEMGPIGYPETSVRNYHYSLRNNPEERSYHLLRDESLKSRKFHLDLQKELRKWYIWSKASCCAETLTLRIGDQIYLESFEM